MKTFFLNRGYPNKALTAALARLSNTTSATQTKSTNNRVPLVITYHTINTKVVRILTRNFKLLQECQDTNAIFKEPPIVAYRRDKNLSDILVRSAAPTPPIQPGTTTCDRRVCHTCTHINYAPGINTPKGIFNITQSFDCTSRNLIYAVTCSKCNKVYIGETKRRLGDRFVEHLRYATQNSRDTPITRHYNEIPHTPSDLRVTGLLQSSGSDLQRWIKEQRIIYNYDTLASSNSNGLNIQFTAFKT